MGPLIRGEPASTGQKRGDEERGLGTPTALQTVAHDLEDEKANNESGAPQRSCLARGASVKTCRAVLEEGLTCDALQNPSSEHQNRSVDSKGSLHWLKATRTTIGRSPSSL